LRFRHIRPDTTMVLLRACVALALLTVTAIAPAAEIVVSAAASLSNAMRDIIALHTREQPSNRVLLNVGGSDVLVAQIAKGAPADVLATADEDSMDRAERQGLLLAGTRHAFARNRLVLVVPAGRPPTRLGDLRNPRFARIAVGNPASVPAGRYARAALERAGLWADVAPRLVFGENVRQVLDYVARGEADAGLVYATDVDAAGGRVRAVDDVLVDPPILYPVALVRTSAHPDEARAFARFLDGAEARAILARHGFALPEP
jgi:molybdate transport system substrate-binding protein